MGRPPIEYPKWRFRWVLATTLSLVASLAMPLDAQDETQSIEPRSFSSGAQTGTGSQPGTYTPSEWSAKMELLVWTALQESDYEITRIERVTCDEPTCEIHFTVVGFGPTDTRLPPMGSFVTNMFRSIGTDEQGVMTVRQASLGSREEYPGSRLMVLRLSTEPPVLPRRLDGYTPDLRDGGEPWQSVQYPARTCP